jgi:hypothetical protein
MSRISPEVLIGAEARVRAMDLKQKEELAEGMRSDAAPPLCARHRTMRRSGTTH